MPDALAQLQSDITALLLADPNLGSVPVQSFRKLTIEGAIAEGLNPFTERVAGQMGTSILILMPSLSVPTANVPGPQYDAELIVRCFENPILNTTGRTAEQNGIEVLEWLDGLPIENLGLLLPATGQAMVPNYEYEGLIVYDCGFRVRLARSQRTHCVAAAISATGLTVTLTPANAADEVWFTTDGTMPAPAAPGAQLYTTSFAVEDSTELRWATFAANSAPSRVGWARITA